MKHHQDIIKKVELVKHSGYGTVCAAEDCEVTEPLKDTMLLQKTGIPTSYMLCPEHRETVRKAINNATDR